MSKTILYIGGFNFKTGNASSIRVVQNALFFQKIGYKVYVSGKTGSRQPLKQEGITLLNINNKEISSTDFATSIESIRHYINLYSPHYVIAYNYPAIAFFKLQHYCKKKPLRLIPDVTEWHGIDGRLTIPKIIRAVLITYKMRVLNKKCPYIILATDYLVKFYKNSDTLLLPFVTTHQHKASLGKPESKVRNFVFAGTTGKNFSKDRLDVLLKAFSIVKKENTNFCFHVIGPSKKELEATEVRQHILDLDQQTKFYGRLPNKEVKAILSHADYTIFARDIKRITKVGYPTKVFEAFDAGIPVITNNTSNLESHIKNGINGFLLDDLNINDFADAILKAIVMEENELNALKEHCINNNPFYYKLYTDKTLNFMRKACKI